MRQYIRLFLFLLSVLLCGSGPAWAGGQPLTRHITMQDGLPSNVVYDVFEDSKGFMWFCTDQGVSRYDGANFRHYALRDGIPDMTVFRIREDQQQRYWLICYNEKACYLQNGKVYTSANDPLCRKIEAEGIAYDELFIDRDGNDCLAGRRIGVLSSKPPYLRVLPGIKLHKGRVQHFRRNGEDYAVTNEHVYNLNTGFQYKFFKDHKKGYVGISFYDGHAIFTSGIGPPDKPQELYQWQFEGERLLLVKQYSLPGRVFEIGPVRNNKMSLSTACGMLLQDCTSGKIIPDTTFPAGIQANRMRTDREGNYWLSTLNDGVYFMPANGGRIIDIRSGLTRNNILSLTLTRGGDLIAGDDAGGVYRIKANKIQTYTLDAPQNDNRVMFIGENDQGTLFAGTDFGLYTINHTGLPRMIVTNSMKAGASSGRYFYAGSSSNMITYDSYTGKVDYDMIGRVTAVGIDQQGTLWSGGIKGLYYFKAGKRSRYEADSLVRNCFISGIKPAPGGGILAGSSTMGLFVIRDSAQPALHLSTCNGLSSNNCKQFFVAEDGYIWVCSDAGIDRLKPPEDGHFSIKHFPLPQGVAGNQVNDLVESNGQLFLATGQGILVLNSRDTQQCQAPRLYIETVNGKVPSGRQLRFSYKERNLQVSYAGLSFNGGRPLQYKYVLSGGTDDTLYTQAQAIDFTALSPGAYELLLWCRSPGSEWTTKPVRLSFTILPPLWRHPVSLAIMLLLSASILALLFRLRIRKIKKRAAQETRNQRQLAELEMNALRAQINPHFIFNALNAIQFYYSQNDEITANHYMTSFAHFIRLTLTYSQAHWLPLSEEIAMLRTYSELEQIRYQQLFSVTFDIGPGLEAEQVAIPAMMIQPYVENAINHGLRYLKKREGKLVLSFTLNDNTLCCIVDDNGIGRAQAAAYRQPQHTSMGMKINHQRIETINRMYGISVRMTITDKPETPEGPGGTRVSLHIPLKLTEHDLNHPDR